MKLLLTIAGVCSIATIACSIEYQLGHQYNYLYSTSLSINRALSNGSTGASRSVGFNLKADVTLSIVWQKSFDYLVKLEVTSASSSGLATAKETKLGAQLSNSPVFFHWNIDGSVGKVFVSVHESPLSANLKKGIISLLQLQTVEGQRTEVDTSGECQVKYTVEGHKVKKAKSLCSPLERAGLFDHPSKMLSADAAGISETTYEFADDVVTSADAVEARVTTLTAKRDISIVVQTRQTLELTLKPTNSAAQLDIDDIDSATKQLNKAHGYEFAGMLLGSDMEPVKCLKDCSSLADAISSKVKALAQNKLSQVESASAFISLLPVFRQASKDSILQALKKNPSIEPQLIDLAAAAQTEAATEALMAQLDFASARAYSKAERYLMAVSFSSHPTTSLLRRLLELFKKGVSDAQLNESIGLALGAVTNTYCQIGEQCNSDAVKDVEKALRDAFEVCTDETCKLRILRAARNARLPGTLALLLETAESAKEVAVSFAAIQAIAAISERYITVEGVQSMSKVYHQNGGRKYDSSIRAAALDVVLKSRPLLTHQQLLNIVLSTVNQTDFETSTYVLGKLFDLADTDGKFRAMLKEVTSDPRVKNYNSLAPGGRSSALTSFLGKSDGAWVTYSLFMHNSRTSPRSSMNVDLASSIYKQPVLNTDLYAQGLESAIGGSNDEAGAEEEVSAGMALSLVDVLLRPIEFFRGSSGLMSAVWNAPSEPVSALAMNILLHDVNQRVHLQNGMIIEAKVQGVASIDLSGAVSISLWNRDAHSVVKNSGAVVLQGSVIVAGGQYLNASVDFRLESASVIDFSTDVSFYEMPIRVCLRMSQEPFIVKQSWTKSEIATGGRKKFRAQINKVQKINGASFLLNEKNSVQCTEMLES